MFEKEQELLKKVCDRKNVLVGGSWSIGKDLWIIQDENFNLHWTIFVDNVVSLVDDKTMEKKIKFRLHTVKYF